MTKVDILSAAGEPSGTEATSLLDIVLVCENGAQIDLEIGSKQEVSLSAFWLYT